MKLSQTIPSRYRLLTLIAVACVLLLAGAPGRAAAQGVNPFGVEVVQTSANLAQHLTPLHDLEFGRASATRLPTIAVNTGVRYQSVGGFGAAMTDTSAWLIERELRAAARNALMNELFAAGGIRLNFVRVPMGASDFTMNGRPYTYDDMAPGKTDPSLTHFSIAHDEAYILPALREALAIDPQTEFMASPWTPPAWMKANDSLSNAGNLGTLQSSAYGPWGEYFAKFIRAYAQAGVPIGAITPQNEPGIPTAYPGLNFAAGSEANWIVQDLEPALSRAGLHPKLYGDDLGWGPSTNAFATTAVFGRAGQILNGLAWHCYFGAPGVMNEFRQAAPRLDQIVDECSPGRITPTPTPEIVIASMRDWASTVALWNLALDPHGGPVQVPNHGCSGCVGLATINERTGSVSLRLSYYQLGQASAFVAPGAQRIKSAHFVSYAYSQPGVSVVTPGLDDVAFRNPDGSLVLVAYDNSPAAIRFAVNWSGRSFSYRLPAQAMVTFVWDHA
jgi:glucosylceramidase